MKPLSFTTASCLNNLDGIVHGFFGRDSFQHESQICEQFGLKADHFVKLQQQHTATVHRVDHPVAALPIGDGLVTAQPGLALFILSADCVPVLLADPVKKLVAAAHAGWRGAVKGILESTVEEMKHLGSNPADIKAALGPCIWQESYEIGPDVLNLMKDYPGSFHSDFLKPSPKPDHFYFDLPGYVAYRLKQAKVGCVEPSAFNTYDHPDRFISYRYETSRHLPAKERQASVIFLK